MSGTPTPVAKPSTSSVFSRSRPNTTGRHLTSEIIASDIAAFKRRGGSIEVLSTTPSRSPLVSPPSSAATTA